MGAGQFKITLSHYHEGLKSPTIDIFFQDTLYVGLRHYFRSEADLFDDVSIALISRFFQAHLRLRRSFEEFVTYYEDLNSTEIFKKLTDDELKDMRDALEQGVDDDILDENIPDRIIPPNSAQNPAIEESADNLKRSEYNIRTRMLALYKLFMTMDPMTAVNRMHGWSMLSDKLREQITVILKTMGW